MSRCVNSKDSLSRLIKYCVYYDLSEIRSLDFINHKLSTPISRSTYYNHKRCLFQDEKFQSLKKSIFKSKMLKSLMLYMDDDADDSNCYELNTLISKQFPKKQDVFHITDGQFDKGSRLYNKIKSNFYVPDYGSNTHIIHLPRLVGLPNNYTIREEYIRCGKDKVNKCKSCRHGPYYYAYWREKSLNEIKSILRKKYLGTINPRL